MEVWWNQLLLIYITVTLLNWKITLRNYFKDRIVTSKKYTKSGLINGAITFSGFPRLLFLPGNLKLKRTEK